MSFFTDIGEGDYVTDPSVLAAVLAQIVGGTSERFEAVGRSAPTFWGVTFPNLPPYPEPTIFNGIRVEHALQIAYWARRYIAILLGPENPPLPGGLPLRALNQETITSAYRKDNFQPWTSVSELLVQAGYPDGWSAQRRAEDATIWYQLRDCLKLLRYYAVYVWFVLGPSEINQEYEGRATIYEEHTWAEIVAQAWGARQASANQIFGYFLEEEGGQTDNGIPISVVVKAGQRAALDAVGAQRFRGEVLPGWEYTFARSGRNQALQGETISFTNELGHTLDVGHGDFFGVAFSAPPHGPDAVERMVDAPYPMTDVAHIEFWFSTPPTVPNQHPFDLSYYPNPQKLVAFIDPGEYPFSVEPGLSYRLSTLWKCDAHGAFLYT